MKPTLSYTMRETECQSLSETTPCSTDNSIVAQPRVYHNDELLARLASQGLDAEELLEMDPEPALLAIVKRNRQAVCERETPFEMGVDLLLMGDYRRRAKIQDGYKQTHKAILERAGGLVGNVGKRGRTDALYRAWVIDAQLETDAEWFGGLKPTHLIQPFILRRFVGVRDYKPTYPNPYQNRRFEEDRFILYHPSIEPALRDCLSDHPAWSDAVLIPDCREDYGEPSRELWEAILTTLGMAWGWTAAKRQPVLNLEVLHFWSAGDLRAVTGDRALHTGLNPTQVRSADGKRSITPSVSSKRVTRVELYLSPRIRLTSNDCSGIGQGGLEEKLARVGLSTETKALVQKREKGRLDEVAEQDPARFLAYALGDVGDMANLQSRETQKLQKIAHEILKIRFRKSGENSRALTMPKSTGACVAAILEAFVLDRISRNLPSVGDGERVDYTAVKDWVKSTGSLVPTRGQSELQAIRAILDYNSDRPISAWKRQGRVQFDVLGETQSLYHAKSKFVDTVLDGGASTTLAYRNDSGINLAVVAGGRCNSERPYKLGWKGSWINPDMSGCYGNALRDFEYPVGKPKFWTKDGSQAGLTLGDFLKRFERELVPNLWVASLDCDRLPFAQDLLYSKPVDPLSVRKSILQYLRTDDFDYGSPTDLNPWFDLDTEAHEKYIEGGSEATPKRLPSEYVLLREQLLNAPLTSNSLEILRKVCSKREWAALCREVRVSALVYYPASERVSIEEYTERFVNYKTEVQEYETPSGRTQTLKRPEFWTTIPLSEFVGPLLDDRKRIKKAMKATRDEAEKQLLNGEQTFLKLVINTTYGVLCSIFFDCSNAVLASNITDRARCGAWQMAKALGTVHTITDGGYFDADRVPVLTPRPGRRVGLEGLATLFLSVDSGETREWERRNTCSYTEERLELPDNVRIPEILAELRKTGEGKTIGKSIGNDWDDRCSDLVLKRILQFWTPYGLGFNYGIENKDTEYTDALAYSSRSDYFFIDHAGEEKAKIRGTKAGVISEFEDELENGRFKLSAAKLLPGTDQSTLPETINNEPVKRRFMRAVHRWIVDGVWEWDTADTLGLQPATMKLALWRALDAAEVAPNCNYHKVLRNFAINETHFPMPDYKTAKRVSRRLSSDSLYERHLSVSPKKMLDAMIAGKLAG